MSLRGSVVFSVQHPAVGQYLPLEHHDLGGRYARHDQHRYVDNVLDAHHALNLDHQNLH
jgi:hypothetical protein